MTTNPHFALKGDLTTAPVGRLLVKLTVPMVWGLLAMISFQLANMYFVAGLGTTALIAIGFTFPITMFVLSLTIAMGISTSSIVSRKIGEGAHDDVRRLSTHALMIAGFAGILIALIGIPLIDPVFRAMGADDETLPLIRDFMVINFAGTLFLAILIVGNAALRASGDALSPAVILVLCAIINVGLDPILIYGLFGFPRLEMKGAAIANIFSDALAMLASLYILAVRKKIIGHDHLNFIRFKDTLKKFMVIAIPVGIANSIQPVANVIVTGMLASSGYAAVAAFGIAARVEAFAFIVIMALATGMAPIIGQNWGARLFTRVNDTLKVAFGFAFLWSILVALILGIGGTVITGFFTVEPDVIHATLLYFWIVPVSYACGNLVNGWASAFNAMGLPKNAFMLIAFRTLVLTLPFAAIGSYIAGMPGIFAGIAAANIIAGTGGTLFCLRLTRALKQETTIQAS